MVTVAPPGGAPRKVRDDPDAPDPAFAELYASLPDAEELDPWLGWCRQAAPPVLYLGAGAGRLAVPLQAAGVEIVGVDAHPGMLARLRSRRPEMELHRGLVEGLELGRRFDLVIAPSNILDTASRLAAAARHSRRRVAFELVNPHWLAAGAGPGVRVRRMTATESEIEVDYPGGWIQEALVRLMWPEAIEDSLAQAGLALELMVPSDAQGGLSSSPSFYVLARRKRRSGTLSRHVA
jgi:Methyltransferase domain